MKQSALPAPSALLLLHTLTPEHRPGARPNRVVEGRDRIAPLTQAAPISHVHVALVALGLLPNLQQDELTNHLVGEGATHYEQRVPSGTNEIEEAAISEENNPVAIRKKHDEPPAV